MRIPDHYFTIEPRVKVQCLSSGSPLGEAYNKGPIDIAKRNSRDHNDMARSEWLRCVIAEGVIRVPVLDEGIGKGIRLSMINLVDILNVLVNRQAADVVQWHPELECGVCCSINCDVETIVAHKDIHLESVSWNKMKPQ